MKQITLLFLISYAIERLLETFWKRTKLNGKILAPYSLSLIVTAYVSFYFVVLRDAFEAESLYHLTIFAGMTVVIAASLGRHWAIKTLGVYHSIHIEIREKHELIQSGPYLYLRNPYYLSNIIEAIGLPLVVSSKLGILIALFVYTPVLLHRLIREEKALETKFQGLYIDYKRRVPMIVPRFSRSVWQALDVNLRIR
jgi:protein-S-isoprenylcysteine O-methyltransferase Ste14